MGRLVVEAQGTAVEGPIVQGVAAVGNSDPMSLIVSVTDADGVPVTFQGTQYTWAYGRDIFFRAVLVHQASGWLRVNRHDPI
jgi:hypothetical protein